MMMRCSRNWIKYTMFNFQQIIWISYLWITYEGHSHTQLPFLSAWKLFGQCVFLISQRNIFHRLIYLIKYTTVITSTALYWIAMHFNAVISFVLRRHFVKYYRFVVGHPPRHQVLLRSFLWSFQRNADVLSRTDHQTEYFVVGILQSSSWSASCRYCQLRPANIKNIFITS